MTSLLSFFQLVVFLPACCLSSILLSFFHLVVFLPACCLSSSLLSFFQVGAHSRLRGRYTRLRCVGQKLICRATVGSSDASHYEGCCPCWVPLQSGRTS